MGFGDTALGLGLAETALGFGDAALGLGDAALGSGDAALGLGDTALGVGDAALGVGDAALGVGDAALGAGDAALGLGDTALGLGDTAFGAGDAALGFGDTALGLGDTALSLGTSSIFEERAAASGTAFSGAFFSWGLSRVAFSPWLAAWVVDFFSWTPKPLLLGSSFGFSSRLGGAAFRRRGLSGMVGWAGAVSLEDESEIEQSFQRQANGILTEYC